MHICIRQQSYVCTCDVGAVHMHVRTFANCATTCFSTLGGASWSRGSRAGMCTHLVRIFFRARFDYRTLCKYKQKHRQIKTENHKQCYIHTYIHTIRIMHAHT